MWALPSKRPGRGPSPIPILIGRKETDLGGIARRRGNAEMSEGSARDDASARRALHETLLQKIRFHDFLDRVARLAQSRRDRFNTDRSAAEGLGDQLQIVAIERVEA